MTAIDFYVQITLYAVINFSGFNTPLTLLWFTNRELNCLVLLYNQYPVMETIL